MSYRNRINSGTLLLATALGVSIPAQSDNSGAFIGGMLTSRVMTNMHQRTEAEQQQAYNTQQPVQQAAPAQKFRAVGATARSSAQMCCAVFARASSCRAAVPYV